MWGNSSTAQPEESYRPVGRNDTQGTPAGGDEHDAEDKNSPPWMGGDRD